MISLLVTSVKSFLNVGIDIFVKILGCNFISERVGVGEEKFYLIPIFSLNIVVMKVIHQGFTQVKNAQTKIDRLIKVKLCLLHMNSNEVFIEDRTAIIVWLGCLFWCQNFWSVTAISSIYSIGPNYS